jgi:transcriptional regulator with XRE-family HTH domain
MRDERNWSQEEAAKELKKTQSLISRFESPAYGKMSLQTLVEIAEGFDVGLLIKFVPFSRLVREYQDVSYSALSAKSVSDPTEAARLKSWASGSGVSRGETGLSPSIFRTGTDPGITQKTIERMPLILAKGATAGISVSRQLEDQWQKIALHQ